MKHLVFILWVCLWPLAVSLSEYLDAKRKDIQNIDRDNGEENFTGCLCFIIWIVIAIFVY